MADSARVRGDLLRSELELSYTLATFSPDGRPFDRLRESCLQAAQKGLTIAQKLLAENPTVHDTPELSEKIDRLRSVLASGAPQAPKEGQPELKGQALTRRETEVLRSIAQGHSTKEAAQLLGMSFKTAACHRYRLMDKLRIHETANLVRFAIRSGLVKA